MTIVWSPRALRDLNAHAARLDAFSEGSGLRLKADVVERLAQLDQPLSGRVVPEYMATFLRELIHRPYRILYEVFPDRVEVVAIIHGRQKLPTL